MATRQLDGLVTIECDFINDVSAETLAFVDATSSIQGQFDEINTGISSGILDGAQGIQGIQGSQGIQGEKGDKGDKGDAGDKGLPGLPGAQGLQGTSGAKGDQGTQGTQGTAGTAGAQGIQGIQGIQGEPGTQGIQGIQGIQGLMGIMGLPGLEGLPGLPGIPLPGLPGAAGADGANGTNGTDGTVILNLNNTWGGTNLFNTIGLKADGAQSIYMTDVVGGFADSVNSYCRMFAVSATAHIDFFGSRVWRSTSATGNTNVLTVMTLGSTGNLTIAGGLTTNSATEMNGSLTVTGATTFNTKLPTSTKGPISDYDLTNKYFVDNSVRNSWVAIRNNLLSNNSAFTGTNTFNSHLPSSTVGTVSTIDEFLNIRLASAYFQEYLGLQTVFKVSVAKYGNGNSGNYLEELGFTVIHKSIDFYEHNLGDIIVSNPPFSETKAVLSRLKELGKPFVMIMPSSKINTQYVRSLFKNDKLQIIIPRKRIQFVKLVNGVVPDNYKSVCNFDCFYYCWNMNLEKDIIWLE